jgi:DNA-binding transcriptional LysR family regulator
VLDTRFYWTEPLVWVRSSSTRIDPDIPVPLVSYGEECLFTRSAMTALSQIGRECELAFIGSSLLGLGAAVAAGFGVMALPRDRVGIPGVAVWENCPLPKLPDIFCGIYVRLGADVEEREQVAETIATALRPNGEAAASVATSAA